ncbi:uncharacterized protein LOC131645214 [Vicia villosa]|uniref:uncharacterized protein LOC131645214 n=1 Tax=Vicia villosa TaxID=3911 RepID=UPI00273AC346|nr:uncharacterized protein LOC131645214 [Vicia villosa]
MNGYSKIGSTSHKSRSIDFSDFFSFSQTPKPTRISNTLETIKHVEEPNDNEVIKKREVVDEGERFGVILGRSCSVSSSSSCSAASGFQATVKRAFSIKRSSSSVSERYCRIHDQNMVTEASDELVIIDDAIKNKKKKHKGGKILKVCKRLFGF